MSILFTAVLLLANLSAFKLVQIGPLIFPAGLIFFPLTYIVDDILTEVYGFKVSRRIIWCGLAANFIVFAGIWVTTFLPTSPDWHEASAYNTVYQSTPRIFVGSMLGYFFGEFLNSVVLAKMKILTSGRYLWLRAITSSALGLAVDTILFVHIGFLFLISYQDLLHVIIVCYSVKLIYEICAVPITYKITNFLKRKDNIDHYDYQTKFNPFSLAL